MNKEEILARSRKENELSDERGKYIGLKGANFSIPVLVVLWILLSRLTPLDDTANCAMGLLVTATCFANFAYQLRKNATKTTLFFFVLFLLAAAFYLVCLLKLGFHLF